MIVHNIWLEYFVYQVMRRPPGKFPSTIVTPRAAG